jgi:hypothetical protein
MFIEMHKRWNPTSRCFEDIDCELNSSTFFTQGVYDTVKEILQLIDKSPDHITADQLKKLIQTRFKHFDFNMCNK